MPRRRHTGQPLPPADHETQPRAAKEKGEGCLCESQTNLKVLYFPMLGDLVACWIEFSFSSLDILPITHAADDLDCVIALPCFSYTS